MTNIGRLSLVLLAAAAAIPCGDASAQIGGLIKKKVGQAAAAETPAVPSVGEPVAFDDVILELTPDRIAKLAAGKAAARKIAEGPNGPTAIRKQIEPLDARQTVLYSKHVEEINAWDAKRRDAERCRDSVLTVVTDRLTSQSASQYMEQYRQLALDYAAAQARGDSAAMKRLMAEIERKGKPTRADTLAAEAGCKAPPMPGVVKEWMEVKDQLEGLQDRLYKAEQAVRDAEEQASGMDNRQLAISCERIKIYIARAEAKQRQQGFTQAELEALEQARAELKRLCGE